MKINLYRQGKGMSRPITTKSNILYVTNPSTEGRWAMKEIILTRGRSVGKLKTCNYDIALLSDTVM
jgi:hypothetical protein